MLLVDAENSVFLGIFPLSAHVRPLSYLQLFYYFPIYSTIMHSPHTLAQLSGIFAHRWASVHEYLGKYVFTFISDWCLLEICGNLIRRRIRPQPACAESFLISLLQWGFNCLLNEEI